MEKRFQTPNKIFNKPIEIFNKLIKIFEKSNGIKLEFTVAATVPGPRMREQRNRRAGRTYAHHPLIGARLLLNPVGCRLQFILNPVMNCIRRNRLDVFPRDGLRLYALTRLGFLEKDFFFCHDFYNLLSFDKFGRTHSFDFLNSVLIKNLKMDSSFF